MERDCREFSLIKLHETVYQIGGSSKCMDMEQATL